MLCNGQTLNIFLLSKIGILNLQGCKHTTDKYRIEKELEENDKIILITTYHSSNILVDICKENKYMFDFGIYDESHRTVGILDKRFTHLVTSNIEHKKLFISATSKIYNYDKHTKDESIENIISMDNELIYGKTIYKYSMKKAIEDNVLVDYNLLAPFLSSENFKETDEYKYVGKFDVKTVLIGLMIMSSIEKYKIKHLLIFSNTNEKAKNISDFINDYLQSKKYEYKCIFLSGKDNMTKRKINVMQFENDEIGIISSARIFGEGVDIKKCDEYDYKQKSIIIGTGGNANIKFDKKFSCSADNFIITSEKYNIKYIYYYLLINIHLLENGFKGTTIKHLSKDYLQNIEIPIPDIETQKQIISFCDELIKNIEYTKNQIQNNKKLMKQIITKSLNLSIDVKSDMESEVE